MIRNPQNPYDSYIIEASAGAGKTYQLTRRFLNLVSSGASASSILTITFTVKAANEMKERIIHEASQLLYNEKRQSEFDREMQTFYKDYRSSVNSPVPPPHSAKQTAQAILSCTQLLRVTTIDALFYDWFASFPWEANPFPGTTDMRSLPYEMMDGMSVEELNKTAWEHVFANRSEASLEECLKLLSLDSDQGILGIEQKIFELFRHYTFLWQTEAERGEASILYDVGEEFSEADFFIHVEEDIRIILSNLNKNENFFRALQKKKLEALFEERFFNLDGEISGSFVRGKTRDKVLEHVLRVNEALQKFLRREKLCKLNDTCSSLFALYKLWLQEREKLKQKKGQVEFHDLAIGNYKLFHEESGIGATWFIQKSFQHLMIDECQDTSFLQFSVFRKIIEEILAHHENSTPNTVFLVGDKKQSIYGFREAEPEVLEHMTELFETFEKTCIPLHKSYRSAPLVLNFVNNVFIKGLDPEFPIHSTATDEKGEFLIPNCGRVFIQDLDLQTVYEDKETAVREEAVFLASYLKKALSGEMSHPVYEKKTRTYRPLKASDCVLLYRTSTHVEIFEEVLREHNINFLREEKRGFYSRPEIRDILALLKFLCDPTDTVSLLTYLRSPFGGISDSEILSALSSTQALPRRELAILECFKDSEVGKQLIFLMREMHVLSPSKILDLLLFKEEKDPLVQKNLFKLYETVLKIENENHHSLREVLEELELCKERNDEASASAEGDAVRLMTIHKAKGLEFPFVALIKTSEQWYRMDRYWAKVNDVQNRGLALVGTQKQRPRKDLQLDRIMSSTEKNLEEEAERLLYVALTRASQYLLISAHQTKNINESFYPLLRESFLNGDYEFFPDFQYSKEPILSSEIPESVRYVKSNRVLPDQISIVHPSASIKHSVLENQEKSSEMPFQRRFVGLVVHEALAKEALGELYSFENIWKTHLNVMNASECSVLLKNVHLEKQCRNEVLNIVRSEAWKQLFEDLETVVPEFRIVQLRKQKLLMGSCDLFLQKKSGEISIVEWKTADVPVDVDLYEFAQQMGFVKQLSLYVDAVKALHSGKNVSGLVWFTKYDRPIRAI